MHGTGHARGHPRGRRGGTIGGRRKSKWNVIFHFVGNARLHNNIHRILFMDMSTINTVLHSRVIGPVAGPREQRREWDYRAKVTAASLTLSSLLFFTTRIFLGFDGHVNLYTLPAGLNSSNEGRGGTDSGFRKGNVGVEGGCGGFARNVGVMRSGRVFVERRVEIRRRKGLRDRLRWGESICCERGRLRR